MAKKARRRKPSRTGDNERITMEWWKEFTGQPCGRREPIDEFVSLLRRELNEKTYQCCRKCVFFVRMNHANVQQS